jgi:hypothetical protein
MPVDALWARQRPCSTLIPAWFLLSSVGRTCYPAPVHIVKWRQLCWASATHLAWIHGPINELTQRDPQAKLTPNNLISDCVLSPHPSSTSPSPLLFRSSYPRSLQEGRRSVERSSTACALESSENGHDQSTRRPVPVYLGSKGKSKNQTSIKTFVVSFNSSLSMSYPN